MADINAYLSQALAGHTDASGADLGLMKQLDVLQAGAQKAAELGTTAPFTGSVNAGLGGAPLLTSDQVYRVAAAKATGKGLDTFTDPVSRDLLTMGGAQFEAKYGPAGRAVLGSLTLQGNAFNHQQGAYRDTAQTVPDVLKSAGLGVASLGYIPAAAAGLVSPETGANMAEGLRRFSSNVEAGQSAALQAHRAAVATIGSLDTAENQVKYQRDRAGGENDFVASLKKIGRNTVDSFKDTASDGTALSDAAANMAGGFLAADGIAKGIGAGAKALLPAASTRAAIVAAGTLDAATNTPSVARMIAAAATSKTGQALAEHAPMAAANAVQMGAQAYGENAASIMEQDPNELYQSSPEFKQRVDAGEDPTHVQADLANRAGQIAGAVQTPIAGVSGLIAARFRENPLHVTSLPRSVADVGLSTAEGAIQASGGQVSQNLGRQQTVDPNQDLGEGVGEAAGNAALIGLATAGGLQAPGLVAKGLHDTARAGVDTVLGRSDRIDAQNQANSPIAASRIKAGLKAAGSTLAGLKDTLSTLAPKANEASSPTESDGISDASTKSDQSSTELNSAPAQSNSAGAQSDPNQLLWRSQDSDFPVQATGDHRMGPDGRLYARVISGEGYHTFIPADELYHASGEPYTKSMDVQGHANAIDQTVRQDPDEEHSSPAVTKALHSAGDDRLQALRNVSDLASSEDASPEDRLSAGLYLKEARAKNQSVLETSVPAVLDHLSKANPEHPMIPEIRGMADSIAALNQHLDASKPVQQGINDGLSKAEQAQPSKLSAEHLATPAGRQLVDNVTKLAEHAPDKLNPDTVDQIQLHATKGGAFTLTPEQKAILTSGRDYALANRQAIEQARATGIKSNPLVAHEAVSNTGAQKGSKGESAFQHMNGVVQAMKAGDHALAQARLRNFLDFAQHYQNKLEAMNTSLAKGDGSRVAFQARDHETGHFGPSDAYLNPRSVNSVTNGQHVAMEAQAITRLANSLTKTYPKLKLKPIPEHALHDPQLVQQSAKDFVKRYRDGSTQVQPNSIPVEAPVNESEAVKTEAAPEGVASEDAVQQDSQTRDSEIPTVSEAVAEQPAREAQSLLEKTYPGLLGSAGAKDGASDNMFVRAFRVPEQVKSRIFGQDNPARDVYRALTSQGRFRDMAGAKRSGRVDGEVSDAYGGYLKRLIAPMRALMQRRLDKMMAAGHYGSTIGEAIRQGQDVNRLRKGKILNLVELGPDGTFRYHQALQDGALLAGLQWLIESGTPTRLVDKDDLARNLKLNIEDVPDEWVTIANTGRSLEDSVTGLASRMVRYWGVNADPNMPEGYTKGIPEAMAKEVIRALQDQKLIELRTEKVNGKDWIRVISKLDELPSKMVKGLKKFPSAIEHLVVENPQEQRYLGAPPLAEDRSKTQLRNPMVALTGQQETVLAAAEATQHWLNKITTDFANNAGVGLKGLKFLFGIDDTDNEGWNVNYKESVKGYNQMVEGAWKTLQDTMDDLESEAENQGMAAHDLPMFFKYDFNKVVRLQMDSAYNQQSNKLIREWMAPTRSTLDLTQDEDLQKFQLALAQAWGIKIHNIGVDASVAKTGLFALKIAPATRILQDHLKTPDLPLHELELHRIKSAFEATDPTGNTEFTPAMLHAGLEYARFLNASPAERKAFTTQLYVEADGVTDGMVNALVHFSTGAFSADQLKDLARGGLFFVPGQTLAGHRQLDGADLYKAIQDSFQSHLKDTQNEANSGTWQTKRQMQALSKLMGRLLKDVRLTDNGDFKIERGSVKNPATISLYGSSDDGIAGNIASELVNKIYELMSKNPEQARTLLLGKDPVGGQPYALLDQLTSFAARRTQEGKLYVADLREEVKDSPKDTGQGAEKYTLSSSMMKHLKENILQLFVKPMVKAIKERTNVADPGMNLTNAAVQAMSIFQHHKFVELYNHAIIDRKLADPTFRESDGLSQKEIRGLWEKTMDLGPLIETGTQNIYPAGASTAIETDHPLSGDTEDKLRTGARIQGPVNAGARGKPFMNIAPGDGQLIQNVLAPKTARRTVVGGLPIYDGFHTKLSTLFADHQNINQAVYEAWQGAPLRAVHQAFERFTKIAAWDHLPDDQWSELRKTVERLKGEKLEFSTPEQGRAMIRAELEKMLPKLKDAAIENEARKRAMDRAWTSTDHMAGAESPHQSEGEDLSGGVGSGQLPDYEHIAQRLTDFYHEELKAVRQEYEADAIHGQFQDQAIDQANAPHLEQAAQADQNAKAEWSEQVSANTIAQVGGAKADQLVLIGTPDPKTGVRTLEAHELPRLARELDVPEAHKPFVNELIRNVAAQGYKLVMGAADQLKAWASANGKKLLPDSLADSQEIHGYTVTANKLLYLVKPSAETLVHELIHATTTDKVKAYFDNPKSLSKDEQGAVNRLHALMNEWLAAGPGDTSHFGGDEAARQSYLDAHQDALDAVNRWLEDKGLTEAAQKTYALNEFMAWTLANKPLSDQAKRTAIQSPALKGKMTRAIKVWNELKRLIWKDPGAVPRSLYGAVEFNTRVLVDSAPTIQAQLAEVTQLHATSSDDNPRAAEVLDRYTRLVAAHLNELPNDGGKILSTSDKAIRALFERGEEVADHFEAGGFILSPQERLAVQTLVTAFASTMQLHPLALRRADELHRYVMQKLTWDQFLKVPVEQASEQDRLEANAKYRSVIGSDLDLIGDPNNRDATGYKSALLPAFLALASVNNELSQVLTKMELPQPERDGSRTIDAALSNRTNDALDWLSQTLSGDKGSVHVQGAVDLLTNQLAQSTQSAKAYIDRNTTPMSRAIDQANQKAVGLLGQASDKLVSLIGDTQSRTSSPAMKAALEIPKLFASMLKDDNAAHAGEGIMSMMNRSGVHRALHEFMNELVGRTNSNADVLDLVKLTRTFVAKVRQQFREELPRMLAKRFKEPLGDEDKTHLFKAAQADIALLRASKTSAEVLDLLSNLPHGGLRDEIGREEALVRQLAHGSDANTMLQKTRQLARWMTAGEWGRNPLMNAHAIAELHGETRSRAFQPPHDQLVKAIDRLGTLHALDGLEPRTKERLSYLAQNEPQAVSYLLDYLAGQRKDEQAKITTDAARLNHYKGYIPSENQQGLQLKVADDREYETLVSQGYQRVGDYKGAKAELGKAKRGYYFSSIGKSVFDQGIMQNARATASGVDPTRGYSYGHIRTAGRITDKTEVARIARGQLAHDNSSEPLRAIYGADGKVLAFERMIDPAQELRLNRSTDITTMIGAWRGRQAEEAMAGQYNQRLIDALHDMWAKDSQKPDGAKEYVNLLETHKLDAVTRDAVNLFTPETLAYIQQKFGQDGFMVRKDLENDAVGYRQASVGDAWTGVTRWSPEQTEGFRRLSQGVFGQDAYKTLVQAERNLQGVVSKAKDTIVVKSLVIPVINIIADMYQLSARGVPFKAIMSGYPAKMTEVRGYVQRQQRAVQIEADLRAATNDVVATRRLNLELQAIQDADRSMSVWPLIQAGEFDQIAEGLSDVDMPLFKGQWKQHFDQLVDKLPEQVKSMGRYAVLTHDTALYQGLHKAVSYGDFLAKSVMYEDLVKRQGLDPQTALGKVSEEFINYDRLAGRTRSYAESMGLTWFWNYKIRAAKVAVSMMRNNPVQALLTGLVPSPPLIGGVGSPMMDNIFTMGLDGRLLRSIGPGMGFHAIGMNPWLNLTNQIH